MRTERRSLSLSSLPMDDVIEDNEQETNDSIRSATKQVIILAFASYIMKIITSSHSTLLRSLGSMVLGVGLAFVGYKKKFIDMFGSVAAALVGCVTIFSGLRFGLTLGFFFFASSAVTKIRSDLKRQLDEHFKEGGCRNWVQVLANGLLPTCLAFASWLVVDKSSFGEAFINVASSSLTSSRLSVAFLAYFSCCGGDTFASELGVLSKTKPRLITTFREVEAGTNGGVTVLGLCASSLGGVIAACGWAFGALFINYSHRNTEVFVALTIGALGGLLGSFVDSLLGATIQYSGYCSERKKVVSRPGKTVTRISGVEILSNSGVNVVSAASVTLLFGFLA